MPFIRYRKYGQQEYAYEVTAYWDSEKKCCRQKSKYLGVVVDKKKKIFERRDERRKREKLILDFGDSFLLQKFLEDSGLYSFLKKVFNDQLEDLLALLSYKICYGSAMMYANTWYVGNYAKIQYKNANLASQRISDFLVRIGDEQLQRCFFLEHIHKTSKTEDGIIIDTTSLPNQIHIPLTKWGLSGEEIDKQIRFLLVVDKISSTPLFFRILPGNIIDVSTLKNTTEELRRYGIRETFVFLDAGFFSEDNIREMYNNKLNFLIRLPGIRNLFKELISSEAKDLESISNAVRYGKRGLFIKQKKIKLFGKTAYAHIVLDPERKGREVKKLLLTVIDEKSEHDKNELDYELMKKGIMILVSSFKIKREEIVPTYYVRQSAERLFGFSKDDLKIIPLRVHSEEALRGYLLVQFIALLIFTKLKQAIGNDYTVEEILLTMRNLKCKVYDDGVLVNELDKNQKEITEKLNILVPKTLGI